MQPTSPSATDACLDYAGCERRHADCQASHERGEWAGRAGQGAECRRQRTGCKGSSALDAPIWLIRAQPAPLTPAEQSQAPAASAGPPPLPGAGRPVARLPPVAAPAPHLQCNLPHHSPAPLPPRAGRQQDGAGRAAEASGGGGHTCRQPCLWASRRANHTFAAASHSTACCLGVGCVKSLTFLCGQLKPQVSGEYNRVCEGCVNADTSSKTFVRAVGAIIDSSASCGVSGCNLLCLIMLICLLAGCP